MRCALCAVSHNASSPLATDMPTREAGLDRLSNQGGPWSEETLDLVMKRVPIGHAGSACWLLLRCFYSSFCSYIPKLTLVSVVVSGVGRCLV